MDGGTRNSLSILERNRETGGTHQTQNEAIVEGVLPRCAKDGYRRHYKG